MTNRDYILKHWQDYDIVDSYDEMINLLDVLEVQGETLDSLHNVALNGYNEFCGIIGKFNNDRDVVEALYEFHKIFNNKADYLKWAQVEADYDNELLEDFIKYDDLRIANDGKAVLVLYY